MLIATPDDPLGFASCVGSILQPLLVANGLAEVQVTSHVADFASPNASIHIARDPYSYEIDARISHRGAPERTFSIADLVDAAGGDSARERCFSQAASPANMEAAFADIARLLSEYGHEALRGDYAIFERMADIVNARSKELTDKVVDAAARQAAESAWERKDYLAVQRLYASLTGPLTDVEVARLEFARRKAEK